MLKVSAILLALVAAVFGSGEFSILTSPDSLEFKGNDNLDTALLPDVFLSSMGYSIDNQENWGGLHINNPFNMAKHAVIFVVDGIDSLKSDAFKSHTYPLSGDAYDLKSLAARVPDSVLIDLENNKEAITQITELFGDVKPVVTKRVNSSLKPASNTEDKEFVNKLATLEALIEKLQSATDAPSVIVVRMSMDSFKQAHVDTPVANAEAIDLLSKAVAQLSEAASKSYGDRLLVASIATTEQFIRHRRQAANNAAPADAQARQETKPDINLAKEYSQTYPVIFNILLWFGVIFFFSLLAICLALAYMDPGRDSIIYRMTSTRMKKDN